jgi:glycosyltransferase involved in cell wall biosynthesis
MKIIHLVLGKANPERMNGVNKVAHNHATHMARLGHDVTVWGITPNPIYDFPERNYKTLLFQASPGKFRLDKGLQQAIEYLYEDVIFHIHGALIPDFFLVTRRLRKKGIPYVYTPHGAFNRIALMKNRWIKMAYINLVERTILKGARKVHFLGGSEFENIDKLLPLNNKILIPNGQDMDELAFEYQKIQPGITPVFGFCGRLDNYYKALDTQLDAFAVYKKNNGQGIFWIIGDGPDRAMLEEKTRLLKIADSVTFFGSLFGVEKLNRIANMDVFFHPSRSEGSPTAVLEACGLGVPCVVSTATNIGEAIEAHGCGIHIKINDSAHLAEVFFTCENLFYSGELRPMGKKAKEMVASEYNWMAIADQLISAYTVTQNDEAGCS